MKKILVLFVIIFGLAVMKPAMAAPIDDLNHAIGYNDIKTVQMMIAADKTLLSATDNAHGATALLWAMNVGHIVIADFLIKNGADVNQPGENGMTPLILTSLPSIAFMLPVKPINRIEFLMQNGANVNQGDKDGETPLMQASGNKEIDIVESLIGHGANVNQVAKYGITALMFASGAGQVDNAALLIKNGADINKVTSQGQTALSIAREAQKLEMVALLQKYGAK